MARTATSGPVERGGLQRMRVLASGELVHTNGTHNADLLWAARGAGPGFFGVVTRFHLRLVRRPKVVVNSVFLYPMDVLEEVFGWARGIGPQVAWATERMRELEPYASGIQLADENLGNSPARFLSDEHLQRLEQLHTKHDPHGCFHSWMGLPTPHTP